MTKKHYSTIANIYSIPIIFTSSQSIFTSSHAYWLLRTLSHTFILSIFDSFFPGQIAITSYIYGFSLFALSGMYIPLFVILSFSMAFKTTLSLKGFNIVIKLIYKIN